MPFDKAHVTRLTGRAIARYIKFVRRTCRVVNEPQDLDTFARAHNPFILAMWHGQFLMVPVVDRGNVTVYSMVARHGDAELIGQVLEHLDMAMIRGSGAGSRKRDRGGAQALRNALRVLGEGHSVAMTADVPPGPARVVGPGIVTLARLSGRPIIPFATATRRYHAFDTWSRMTLNLPFGTLAAVAGEPIFVDRDLDEEGLELARIAVRDALDRATARAYALAGADPTRATPQRPDVTAPPAEPGLSFKAYRAATDLLRPAAPIMLKARARRGKEDVARRFERMGRPSIPRPDGPLVWVHAASVGETNAALPLLPALRAERPGLRFLLTTGTVTSAEVAARRLGPGDIHQFLPLDVTQFVRGFLDHWRPGLAIFTESEIWPNLLMQSSARGIPLALVNARMSKTSFNRWRRTRSSSRAIFSRFAVVLAQNELLARRFANLGARNVIAAGNLKIDAPAPPVDAAAAARLREALSGRPYWLAASTHEGEDAIIVAVHIRLAASHSRLCTIIVPRHPERGSAIAEHVRRQGLSVAQRSQGKLPGPDVDIYVADTLGELGTFYALSAVALVGGSLIPHGGQNPIEAVRRGAAVITGPYWTNFRDAYRALLSKQAALEVASADDLARAVGRLLDDDAELARMRASAEFALEGLSGALRRTVEALLPLLPNTEDFKRAS